MTPHDAGFLLLAVIAAFFANEIWRALGVVLSARLDEDGALFAWVRMVATALVAGLVAKLVLSPSGGFALAPLWLRLGSAGVGIAAYTLGRRSLALGVAAAEVALVLGVVALGA
ncbi:AzlD domain-containing protein [Hansschlegelia sp.]|uniref:AzlD domain-containing protein n=1 Tax=Hansschlegelia sp. TaxID=2041892 RepID=UPI002C969513|nr:AzlD domain-containing protein [Hansschlegelia sp.]HVI29317.1 AzlD domain-containing protein [Hansschlegelia sp.]